MNQDTNFSSCQTRLPSWSVKNQIDFSSWTGNRSEVPRKKVHHLKPCDSSYDIFDRPLPSHQSEKPYHRSIGRCAWFALAAICFLNLLANPSIGQSTEPRLEEGFTEPFKTVVVASADSGVLHSVVVREGDFVAAGDIICTLDSHVLTASMNATKEKLKAQGKINAAKATLDNKAQMLDQMKELLKQEHASDKEVSQAKLDFDLAAANLETARDDIRWQEMDLKRIQAQLERRIIRAPSSGFILELPRQVGEAITATESQVATLVALDYLRARYFLSTDQTISLSRGQRLTVSFPDTQQRAEAIVDFVSPVTDSKSGTVRVELLIKNDKQQFRSGLRCLMGPFQAAQIESTTNR